MKPVLIIQNDAKEGPGLLGLCLSERGYDMDTRLGWDDTVAQLDPADYSGLVVLGGVQGVYESDQYPYLSDEIALIRRFIGADRPVIGLCLGGQLIAAALGGRVYPSEQKEIGWHEIRLAPEAGTDPLLRLHPAVAKAFHFHGDCFDTPPGCINLASSALTDAQLFRLGDRVYGFQFHPEMDTDLVDIMCRQNTEYMAANGSDADAVIAESRDKLPAYQQRTRPMFEAWVDLLDAADKEGVA